MIFLIGEDAWSRWERAAFRGGIGMYYNSTWEGLVTYLIFGLFCLFAIIGIIVVVKFVVSLLFGGKKEKEDPHQKWLRTGKM